ncbi:fused FliR family export protein/FlhB family type III secretion system protein [Hathewaya histolytica]|uniref:fused FliR family export protein/FlhB family type III secretion system protein n=1 Tax=Hathewaya histolytica TaxID=1498 RepID=UPI003B685CDF
MLNLDLILIFIMVLLRITAFFGVLPVLFPQGTPKYAKLLFSSLIAYLILPTVKGISSIQFNNMFSIFYYGANEIVIGLMMGYITNLCFNFIKMGGQYLDVHIGFAMNTLFDPYSNENITLIQKLFYMISVLLYFLINGHHILIKSLVFSYKSVNIGQSIIFTEKFSIILKAFTYFFTTGIRISLPITLIILVINLILGLASRTVPQLNVMILGMPIKILAGIAGIIITLPIIIKMFNSGFNEIPKILTNLLKIGPVIFIFADSGDKTEEATEKKKRDSRKKGQIPKSKDLNMTFSLICISFIIVTFGESFIKQMKNTLNIFLNNYLNTEITYNSLDAITVISLKRLLMGIMPIALPIMVIGIVSNILQSGFLFTGETIKPKLSKLNPINGVKRFFSIRTLVELIKNLAVINILLFIGYKFFKEQFYNIINIGSLDLNSIGPHLNKLVGNLFYKVTLVMCVIAALDYFFQYRQYKKEMRMSKQEVKEEFKQMEGDPQIKGKIRQKQREMAMRRMMQSVPDATVIITNPTHISIALKYEEDSKNAPRLVAKGADNLALKIKEIAKEHEVPIMENKPLARTLYETVELNQEIPENLYHAVAEILAIIYKLKK